MTGLELVKLGLPMLKVMSENGIHLKDWRFIEAFERSKRMKSLGKKHSDIIDTLAKELEVGASTVERAFIRLKRNC